MNGTLLSINSVGVAQCAKGSSISWMESDDPKFICPHMVEKPDEFLVWFTGVGKELNWACRECTAKYPEPPLWVPVSDEWISKNRNEVYWDGIRGSPEVKHRTTDMCFLVSEVQAGEKWGDLVDAQPCLGRPGCWLTLSKTGKLMLFSSADSSWVEVCRLPELKFEITAETAICVSPENDFAVVSEASGPNAALVEVASGRLIKELSRGDYHPQNSHFPVAFFKHEGSLLLIAGSCWNRLDIYDPVSGDLLSERGPTNYVNNERPPHYLDYFHGSLRVSPDAQTVVDNGWVWHPVGGLRSWNLPAWLSNPWESEDGPTSRNLVWRDYFWDGPLCWINNTTLVFWGWGRDDDWLVPAAVVMDINGGNVLRWFPGPKVRKSQVWPPRKLADSFFYDRHLFSVSDEEGTSVWDIHTGECLLVDASVKPWRYHPDSKEFLEVLPHGFKLSKLVE